MTHRGTFALWQRAYADHNIATFPLRADKRPAIKGYMKVGLRGSQQLAFKFTAADALAFLCGALSRVTVSDLDTTDERALADFLDRHGATPIIVVTASGKFHAWYRYNNERRRIRPWRGRAIDILGRSGFVVAPPSKIKCGHYHFVQGSLDDLDRLPVMRNLEPDFYAKPASRRGDIATMRGMREGDGRNAALFKIIGPLARDIYANGGTCDALFEVAMSRNRESAQPMTIEEVSRIVDQVWKYTCDGTNHIGLHGAFMLDHEVDALINSDQDAFVLLAFLRRHQGPSATFWIANGLAEQLRWTRQRLAAARSHLIECGTVTQVRPPWRGNPATYAWSRPVSKMSNKGASLRKSRVSRF